MMHFLLWTSTLSKNPVNAVNVVILVISLFSLFCVTTSKQLNDKFTQINYTIIAYKSGVQNTQILPAVSKQDGMW